MEQIRTFIAIELPEKVKAGLKQVQDHLKSGDLPVTKWVDPESIHLTLKFLGNVNPDQIETINRSLESAAQAVTPFCLAIEGLGAFPNLRRVQVIWVGLRGDLVKLQMLQNKVESNISPLGFPTEKRSFTPHLTLARVREYANPEDRQSLGERVAKTKLESNLNLKVVSISLMSSQLTRTGAIYTRLSSIELRNPWIRKPL